MVEAVRPNITGTYAEPLEQSKTSEEMQRYGKEGVTKHTSATALG
jgi:hypothetical protein